MLRNDLSSYMNNKRIEIGRKRKEVEKVKSHLLQKIQIKEDLSGVIKDSEDELALKILELDKCYEEYLLKSEKSDLMTIADIEELEENISQNTKRLALVDAILEENLSNTNDIKQISFRVPLTVHAILAILGGIAYFAIKKYTC